jgi:hypothetical protein
MLVGAHCVIYSRNAELDRAFIREVLRFPNVDVGGGWLIFGLPPAEVAIHPGDRNTVHEFYLMCDDIEAFAQEMQKRKVPCEPVLHLDWGSLTRIRLPGGGKLGVYEPHHARPRQMLKKKKRRSAQRKAAGRSNARRGGAKRKKTRRVAAKRKAARSSTARRNAAKRAPGKRRSARQSRRSRRR